MNQVFIRRTTKVYNNSAIVLYITEVILIENSLIAFEKECR